MTGRTVEELTAAIAKAQQRGRDARADAAKFAREMASLSRRQETQRLCTLGRALMAMSEHSERNKEAIQRWLDGYISRDVDRDILRGTAWEVPESTQHAPEPVYTQHEQAQYE